MSRRCFSWFKQKKKDKDNNGFLEDIPNSDSQQKQKNSEQQQQKTFDSEQLLVDSYKTTTTDEKPFYIVLIDLKKSLDDYKIHCVEKALTDDDFKYVAISYRWGEVQETTVNTGVGYLATITSFHLNHFLFLCRMIAGEIDLQHMDYVWVDAICVNQMNLEQRKATIYHMTDIYERANYILAVPDLHRKYLEESSVHNNDIMVGSFKHRKYIYHLLQGNIQKLFDYDQQWLDDINVPEDNQRLRHLLTHYTEHFATGFATCRKMNNDSDDYKQRAALQHIYETTMKTTATATDHTPPHLSLNNDGDCNNNNSDKDKVVIDKIPADDSNNLDTLSTINKLHTCNDVDLCPFNLLFNYSDVGTRYQMPDQKWKLEIPRRSQDIRQSMKYLRDLVIDWSSRAWVVSEFHIAKNKSNKMKYWFFQLDDAFHYRQLYKDDDDDDAPYSFFTFHFDDEGSFFPTCGGTCDSQEPAGICRATGKTEHAMDNPFQAFHATMRQQLNEQTFLEKILKTKASRHEDRFHAILPSSEYKSILDNKDIVDSWHNSISTLMSVKLELFKWMTTKHKLELLFLAGNADNMCQVLPTFATTFIKWKINPTLTTMDDPIFPGNFDLTSSSTIQLLQQHGQDIKSSSSSSLCYKLNIKPKEYYRLLDTADLIDRTYDEENFIVSRLLALNLIDDGGNDGDQYDLIIIPSFSKEATKNYDCPDKKQDARPLERNAVVLIGCMARNKWVLTQFAYPLEASFFNIGYYTEELSLEYCKCDENHPGFDIY